VSLSLDFFALERFELALDKGFSPVSAAVSDSLERLDLEVDLLLFGCSSGWAVDSDFVVSSGFPDSTGLSVVAGVDSTGVVVSKGLAVSSGFLAEPSLAVSLDFDFDREERDLDEDLFELFSLGLLSVGTSNAPLVAASPGLTGSVLGSLVGVGDSAGGTNVSGAAGVVLVGGADVGGSI
jgi:hypothetical protein